MNPHTHEIFGQPSRRLPDARPDFGPATVLHVLKSPDYKRFRPWHYRAEPAFVMLAPTVRDILKQKPDFFVTAGFDIYEVIAAHVWAAAQWQQVVPQFHFKPAPYKRVKANLEVNLAVENPNEFWFEPMPGDKSKLPAQVFLHFGDTVPWVEFRADLLLAFKKPMAARAVWRDYLERHKNDADIGAALETYQYFRRQVIQDAHDARENRTTVAAGSLRGSRKSLLQAVGSFLSGAVRPKPRQQVAAKDRYI